VAARATELSEFAPAKINLTLRVGRKRPDGYHDLESLVVFADIGDTLRLAPCPALGLDVDGPMASHAGPPDSNLVLKAARALTAEVAGLQAGHFHLTKIVPVAAGLGGGSSDAAAALRLLARINDLPAHDARVVAAARATGADVPVCLDPKPRIMRGIGEILSAPLNLPHLDAVLVNPGVAVPTAPVFAALAVGRTIRKELPTGDDEVLRLVETGRAPPFDMLMDALASSANDLEPAAVGLFPPVGATLAALRGIATCRLARMSGSGGTCFGLFATDGDAKEAAARIARERPQWWVHSTKLGSTAAAPVVVPSRRL
jgi:4-diphosphocytidyl-2-C-methyl-D-erythritol kinase